VAKISFFRTQGRKASYINTLQNTPLFLTGRVSDSFYITLAETSVFLTGNKKQSFFNTVGDYPVFLTANKNIAFVVTPDPNIPRLLKPKSSLEINAAQTQITLHDETGYYDPDDPNLNPGGFNPDSADYSPYRPKRDAVYLWTVYKIRSRPDSEGYGNNTKTPVSQAQQEDDPYAYPLTLPTETVNNTTSVIKGLYEVIMIVAPFGATYPYGDVNLAQQAATYPNYYVVSNYAIIDGPVINCLNQMRYKYLQSVICGRCDEKYLEVYAIYVGLLNAMQAGEWDTANEYYASLQNICKEEGCDTCSCDC